MSLLLGRPSTPLNTNPAPVPNQELQVHAEAGRVKLDHLVSRAERTVAASQEMFAKQAARELRG